MIRGIFAADAAGGIGKAGSLPWPRDPEDLRWFRSHTLGGIVVMGKNTWLDPMMPKPLPDRMNVVVANSDLRACSAAHLVVSGAALDQTITDLAQEHPDRTLWIIGGARLLASMSHLMQGVHLTRFSGEYGCDVRIDIDYYLRGYTLVRTTLGNGKAFEIYEKLS